MIPCCLSINMTIIYPSQKPRCDLCLFSLHLSWLVNQVNPFDVSSFCFQICLLHSTFCVTIIKTVLISHLDYYIMPSVFHSTLPSGNQGNLFKPQIWSYHSQFQTFHWISIALKISWHLKPFVFWILAQHSSLDSSSTSFPQLFHILAGHLVFGSSHTPKLSA